MIGIFILAWGISFYVFYGWKRLVYHTKENESMITESYKLSLLFGIYILLNALLLLRHQRTGIVGIILFITFIIIQAIIIPEQSTHSKSQKRSTENF